MFGDRIGKHALGELTEATEELPTRRFEEARIGRCRLRAEHTLVHELEPGARVFLDQLESILSHLGSHGHPSGAVRFEYLPGVFIPNLAASELRRRRQIPK